MASVNDEQCKVFDNKVPCIPNSYILFVCFFKSTMHVKDMVGRVSPGEDKKERISIQKMQRGEEEEK